MTLRNPIQLLLCTILILLGLEALGQNQRQKALEQQRLEILKEIESINALLFDTKDWQVEVTSKRYLVAKPPTDASRRCRASARNLR